MSQEIHDILTQIGYTLKDFGNSFRARPIYRNSGNNTSLSINKNTGSWIDFSIGEGGSFEQLIQLSLNLKTKEDTLTWLKDKINIEQLKNRKPKLKGGKYYPEELLREILPINDYWIGRGVSKETLELFKGGLVKSGQMSNRYTFPIFDSKGRILGFAGRDVLNNTDRIKWKLIGDKMSWLYPFFLNYHSSIKEKGVIILVESIGDCLSLWEAGIKNTLVLFGTQLGQPRLQALIKTDPKKIIIATNRDEGRDENPGEIATHKINNQLCNFFDSNQILISQPTKKDFGEMDPKENQEWYDNCCK